MSRTQYIESRESDSIKIYACFNLEPLEPFFSPSPTGNLGFGVTFIWNGFHSDAELFMYEPNT